MFVTHTLTRNSNTMTHKAINVLVGCERSGAVRNAFRDLGHNAWSCDLFDADDDQRHHFKCDVVQAIVSHSWDLIILHPPCTALAVSGNAHYGQGKAKHWERVQSIKWTAKLWDLATARCKHVALENPVGVLNNHLPVKASYVQPWQYGHAHSKKTGLWLRNLPSLEPTKIVDKPSCGYWENQTPSGHNKVGEQKNRAAIRSKTYRGIAEAMAYQWSSYVLQQAEERMAGWATRPGTPPPPPPGPPVTLSS